MNELNWKRPDNSTIVHFVNTHQKRVTSLLSESQKMRLLSCLLFLLLSTSTLAMWPTAEGGAWGAPLGDKEEEAVGGVGGIGGVGPVGVKLTVANDGWRCDCWNSTEGERMLDCQCAGTGGDDTPLELHMDNIQSL